VDAHAGIKPADKQDPAKLAPRITLVDLLYMVGSNACIRMMRLNVVVNDGKAERDLVAKFFWLTVRNDRNNNIKI